MTFVKKMKIGYESLSGGCVVRGVMCVVRCVVNKFIISKNTNRMQQLHLHYQQKHESHAAIAFTSPEGG